MARRAGPAPALLHRKAFVGPLARRATRPSPPLALDAQERQVLLATLNGERFADTAPAAVHATLLDEGRYLGSVRTMYRLLAAHGGSRERRAQLTHPAYTKPELLATGPNQVWSWDITKLKGPAKWTCFHLYVILDIFSRCVVGWLIALRESAELAEQLIAETVARHAIAARFGCIEDARTHCQAFFPWYNTMHRHSGIGYMTPHSVHHGHADAMLVTRTGHPGCRVPGASQSVQEQEPATTCLAHRGMDQPAATGETPRPQSPTLHSKFMTPGVAKSLTRSAGAAVGISANDHSVFPPSIVLYLFEYRWFPSCRQLGKFLIRAERA